MAVRTIQPQLTRRRMERAFLAILACYVLLVARLLYLQGAHGIEIRAQATRARQEEIPVRSHKGSICARDGRPLAVSLYSGTIGFDASLIQPDPHDPKRTEKTQDLLYKSVSKASGLLGIPQPKLWSTVTGFVARYDPKRPHARFQIVKRDVPLDVAQQFRDNRVALLGFGVDDGSKRVYSNGSSGAQVIGYVGSDQRGLAGLELSCDNWMDGKDGYVLAEVDDHRRQIPDTQGKLVSARDGYDVHTTLDANLQQIATEEGQKIVEKYHPLGVSVAAVDPMNGDVLALVSLPTYDPNPGERKTMVTDALYERCASHLYEPGSTLKALTIAGALDDGVIDLKSTFYCSGALQVGNKVIHCVLHGAAERGGHGLCTPKLILRHSCNIGAAQVGMKMGARKLFAIDRKFGLLEPMHLGLPGEQHGRLSFDRHEKIYTDAKAARVAFGHSITTTPLQLALAYAAIANGGTLMKPRLIESLTDDDGHTVKEWKPTPIRRVISQQTAAEVRDMLRDVVANGTGKIAAIPGYQICGKTGTAKKYRRGAYVGSFIGFLPATEGVKPRVVLLVAVDEPQGLYYGAEVAAPAFHAIASRIMALWRVPEDDPTCEQYKTANAKLALQMLARQ